MNGGGELRGLPIRSAMTPVHRVLLLCTTLCLLLSSCSTTRVLSEGEYRLAKNTVKVLNDKDFNSRELEKYYAQNANKYFLFGWNPFLNIYNWQNGKGKGWDKFVTKIGVPPVVYNPAAVDKTKDNISRHLDYIGYYNSLVEGTVSTKKRRVYVDYGVFLGKRYPIESLEFDVPSGDFSESFENYKPQISIHEGDYLSEAALEQETVAASKYFRDNGFFGFNKTFYSFVADTLSVPGKARLKLSVKDYPRAGTPDEAKPWVRYKIGSVNILHPENLKIRPKVLAGLNTLAPGQMYSESEVTRTYSRLSALRMFSSVNINVHEVSKGVVDCDISLSKARPQGFKFNLEASVNTSGLFGISPQLSYYHKNIFHGGETLNLGFMGNFQSKFKDKVNSTEVGASLSLSFPKFLLLPYRLFKNDVPQTDISISYNYQNRPEYRRNIISASYGYSGNYRGRLSYKFYPLQLNVVHLFKLDGDFYKSLSKDPFLRNAYQDHFDFGAGAVLYYSGKKDFYSRLRIDIAGNLLSAFKGLMRKDDSGAGMIWGSPYSQFARVEETLGKTWKFGKNGGQAIATRLQVGAGFAYANSSVLPFEKQFYAGGANSLRGWQARAVGPGTAPMDEAFVIPNQTGDFKLEANIEYRFRMFWKIEGAVFADAGNVWTMKLNRGNDPSSLGLLTAKNFAKGIAADWGLGLRVDLNFLVVRVDWGMRVHDPSRQQPWLNPKLWFRKNGYALHFGIGYPF